MLPLRRKGRTWPYYKVQFRDPKSLAWRDHRREAFDDLVSAEEYLTCLPVDLEARIVRWDRNGPAPIVGE